jgi:hypothetical protein
MTTYFSRRQTHDLAVPPNVEWKAQPGVFINDLFDSLFECHFGTLLQGQSQNMFGGFFHSSPVARDQRMVILFVYYTKLMRVLQSDYDRCST